MYKYPSLSTLGNIKCALITNILVLRFLPRGGDGCCTWCWLLMPIVRTVSKVVDMASLLYLCPEGRGHKDTYAKRILNKGWYISSRTLVWLTLIFIVSSSALDDVKLAEMAQEASKRVKHFNQSQPKQGPRHDAPSCMFDVHVSRPKSCGCVAADSTTRPPAPVNCPSICKLTRGRGLS